MALRRFMYKYLKSRNICLTFLFCFNIEGNFLMIKTKNDVKNTVSWDFWPFFAKKIRPGPRMKRQKPFCQLFNFREDIQSPSAKILCACIRWLRRVVHVVNTIVDTHFSKYCNLIFIVAFPSVDYADTLFSQKSSRKSSWNWNQY